MTGTAVFTYGTAGVAFVSVGAAVKGATADTGIPIASDLWLQGFAQTGPSAFTPVVYLYFDNTITSNWVVQMGVSSPAGTSNVNYTISYYSK
jgi:hypothetical protein